MNIGSTETGLLLAPLRGRRRIAEMVLPPRVEVVNGRWEFSCSVCDREQWVAPRGRWRMVTCPGCRLKMLVVSTEAGARVEMLTETEAGLLLSVGRRRWRWGAVAAVIVAGYGMLAVGMLKASGERGAAPQLTDEDYRRKSLKLVSDFLQAPDWRSKAKYVRDAERVAPLMERWYGNPWNGDPSLHRIVESINHPFSGGVVTMFRSVDGHGRRRVFSVEHGGAGSFLDWELYALPSRSWREFQANRTTTPTEFTVEARAYDHYVGDFTDRSQYLCLQLGAPDQRSTALYAYLDRSAPDAADLELRSLVAGAEATVPLTVKLAFPEESRSSNQVRLVEVIQRGWRLPE